jgi:acetyl esterase/lipase
MQKYGVNIEQNLDYLGPDRKEKMDLYLPAGGKDGQKFPAILCIHGGGWVGGAKDAAREKQMGDTFAKAGFVTASINYQLGTADKPAWPQCLWDCKTAVRFLRANADKYHIDETKIGVIGGSAGGHLSMMVAFTGDHPELDPPAGSPYANFSCKAGAVVDLYGVPDVKDRIAKGLLGENPDEKAATAASPITYVAKDRAPLFILHGTADKTVPIEWSEKLASLCEDRGAKYLYLRVDGAPHTFLIESKHGDFRSRIVGFFRKQLGVE